MCGIAGVFDTREKGPVATDLLEAMNQQQFHRGPDEGAIHQEPGLGLAHRRLSIIDRSFGQQPLFNDDGTVGIVFNGEIYNFREVRGRLERRGHRFRTASDTEVILRAWEAWGEDCVTELRGMFAFAIWDRNQETLFLARDRLGIKPLFYALLDSGELLFASELKALCVHPRLKKQLELSALEDYFALGYVPEPKTIYQGVYKLEPGHSLCIRRHNVWLRPKRYWDLSPRLPQTQPESLVLQELVERLKEAVDIRLVSEVPLGAFLSGGVDSSAVVAMMAQLQTAPVNTCAIGFDHQAFDETAFARQVADRYQTNHRVREVESDDFGLIDRLALLYDEPYADSSAIPTYRVCELAREQVTVALSGDGGDEVFAGYRRYRWHMNEERLRGMLPIGVRRPLFGTLGEVYPKADWAPKIFRAKTTFQALARDSVEAYLHSVSLLSREQRQALFSADLKQHLEGYDALSVFQRHADNCPYDDPLSLIQYLDIKTYLVGDILTKVDRASMAHSLEVRVPFLDHPLVEWASTLSPTMKLRGKQGKYLLKKAMEPHLPREVLYREKMGFAVPLASWFRGPLRDRVRDSLLGQSLRESGLFNMGTLEKMITQHQSGVRDHSTAIWTALMFESFYRQCFKG